MATPTIEQLTPAEALVYNEAAVALIAELVKARQGNESQQRGKETNIEGNEEGDIESNDSITPEESGNEKSLVADSRQEVILDVEKVIDTYNLICPKCSACISKRVILRKKEESSPYPEEPLILRCLRCFTIFIGKVCGRIDEPEDNGKTKQNTKTPPNEGPSNVRPGGTDSVPTSPKEPGRPSNVTPEGTHEFALQKKEGTHECDILKSIIYGGLIETITSLGVVSSAAASDATTLNIVVLGLSNLISGLLIVIHNITELKNACDEKTSEANPNIARYQETLGKRKNFHWHVIVAVMSFLVFGLIPLVTYAFSFPESNDKSYKLITCAAASLVCIIFLSIGKAYVQKSPMFYTILKYLLSGLSASGLCYAAGLLINRFLKDLGWFETTSALSTAFLETRSMKSGSAFY